MLERSVFSAWYTCRRGDIELAEISLTTRRPATYSPLNPMPNTHAFGFCFYGEWDIYVALIFGVRICVADGRSCPRDAAHDTRHCACIAHLQSVGLLYECVCACLYELGWLGPDISRPRDVPGDGCVLHGAAKGR